MRATWLPDAGQNPELKSPGLPLDELMDPNQAAGTEDPLPSTT